MAVGRDATSVERPRSRRGQTRQSEPVGLQEDIARLFDAAPQTAQRRGRERLSRCVGHELVRLLLWCVAGHEQPSRRGACYLERPRAEFGWYRNIPAGDLGFPEQAWRLVQPARIEVDFNGTDRLVDQATLRRRRRFTKDVPKRLIPRRQATTDLTRQIHRFAD